MSQNQQKNCVWPNSNKIPIIQCAPYWMDNDKAKSTEKHLNFSLFPPVVGQPPKIEGNGMNSTYNCSFQHIIGFLGVRPWASWKIKLRSTWEIEKSLGYLGVFRKDKDSY